MENEHCVANVNISEPNNSLKVNMVYSIECATNGDASLPAERSESQEPLEPREFTGQPPDELYVYRCDVVRCQSYDGLVGFVTEVAGDSDSDSGIRDGEDEDDDDAADGGGGGGVDNGSRDNDNKNSADKSGSLLDGQVRVTWLDHSETTNNLSELTVVDRGFWHGNMVAAISDPTGQLGVVVDVHKLVDLQAADGSVIKGVSTRHLQRIRDFSVGDYVVHGSWLGKVDDVLDNVTVLFDDGSICKVMKVDPYQLNPVSKNIIEDAQFPYRPGQHVRASSSSVFKNARWLSGAWKASRLEGTVVKVQAGSVFVYWISSANPGYGSESAGVPCEEQSPKNLTVLSCFTHTSWQLGDWCLLPSHEPLSSAPMGEALSGRNSENLCKGFESDVKSSNEWVENENKDTYICCCSEGSGKASHDPGLSFKEHRTIDLLDSEEKIRDKIDLDILSSLGANSENVARSHEPVRESWPVHCKKIRKVVVRRHGKARRRGQNYDRALLVVNTMTKVDVVWQDGTREFGRDSKTLIVANSPGDHEFCPEQYVVEKAINEDYHVSEVRRVGVVKSVNSRERTTCVRWLKPVERPEDPREFDNEEVMSVYELDDHSDYDYWYGDVVVRLSPVSVAANGDRRSRKPLGHKRVEHASKNQDDVNLSGLSWVGNITGLKDGDIEVTWADGMVSKVGPQTVYVVNHNDDEESIEGGSGACDDDAASWETFDENEMNTLENENPSGNNFEIARSSLVDLEEENPGRNGPMSIRLAALGFVNRVATGLVSWGRKQIDPLGLDSQVTRESGLEETLETSTGLADHEFNSQEFVTLPTDSEVNSLENIDTLMSGELDSRRMRACYEDVPYSFKRFDIAKDPRDHYYLCGNGQAIVGGRKWVKKVQQEWNILENNLPDGIYVRVYEDRMDLLRGVIVGAYGTPYHDGLFFFDFHLPTEYPQVPPSVYYHSGGLRLNPNLYEDGKVCLSLLNTWTGKRSEVWNPSSSNILQVLVSLQGLVLNSKPYFNEPGYDKQVGTAEGEKNSLSYSENTFLLNCKSMLYLLRRPPKHFEELVKQHFRRRGCYIIKACEAYMNGCLVGSLTKDACRSDKSGENSNSVGFKLMLDKLMLKLLSVLCEAGIEIPQPLLLKQL
ncbi:putative ubiquitin-conjugating enzyme E2 23 [Tasmannia lanceolata]|uniref:putative ubiquitin-conjugating enzyme E2 23 n=1 Tax=Tasmannia lanceolata TaxID=3420 RepID=UPI004063B248